MGVGGGGGGGRGGIGCKVLEREWEVEQVEDDCRGRCWGGGVHRNPEWVPHFEVTHMHSHTHTPQVHVRAHACVENKGEMPGRMSADTQTTENNVGMQYSSSSALRL